MYDPLTVAFDIKYPWRAYRRGTHPPGSFLDTYHNTFITIWHKDPEKRRRGMPYGRGDDTCDWSGRSRRMNPREEALTKALDDLLHTLGNPPFYPNVKLYGREPHKIGENGEHVDRGVIGQVELAWYAWRRHHGFRWHPRWHVHHWRLQIHPAQELKRFLFSRCADCGGRFKWGESGWTNQWDSGGPRWFRGERDFHHMGCGGHGEPSKEVVKTDNPALVAQ